MPTGLGARLTRSDLAAADDVVLPDLVRPGLRLLLVGINPGRHSGATGFHFGNPRNLLWPALAQSGLTPRQLRPDEANDLLSLGIGITNLVMRTTKGANDLRRAEYREGADNLRRKVADLKPGAVAILGKGPYEIGFKRNHVVLGPQDGGLEGSALWVLPNPSPINRWYPLDDLVRRFSELRHSLGGRG